LLPWHWTPTAAATEVSSLLGQRAGFNLLSSADGFGDHRARLCF
jgi:hypothetical protein